MKQLALTNKNAFCAYLDAVDASGHASHWGSSLYYEMAKEKDRQVAGILDALDKTKTSSGKVVVVELKLYAMSWLTHIKM